MHATTRESHAFTALIVGVVQSAVWIALAVAAVRVALGFEGIFRDFEAPLPVLTQCIIGVTRLVRSYWPLALVPVLLWPFVNWVVVSLLSWNPEVAAPRLLWYIATWLAPVVVFVLIVVSLFVPLITLMNRLS